MAKIETPRELFAHKLGAALTMENTILGIIEELDENANDTELRRNLRQHYGETEQQIRNLEQAFESFGEEPEEQPSPVVDALKKEGTQNLKQVDDELNDAVILSGVVETEAHEIAVYDGLITHAEALGEREIVTLLRQNLQQEQQTLQKARKATEKLAQHVGATV